MNILKVLISGIIFISIYSSNCFAQDKGAAKNEYESCCGTKSVEFSYDKKNVYVPNVFTPNKDGINDLFSPFFNETVTEVWGFTIFSAKGDTVIFRSNFINAKMEMKEYGWNGLRKDGTPYKGLFRYKMRIDDRHANKHIVEGFACAVLCEPNAKILQTKEGCFYPSQAGEKGSLNKEKPNQEKECQ